MLLQLRKCDFGIIYNEVKYDFTEYVDGVTIEDTESKHLVRGRTGVSKKGLIYSESLHTPKRISVSLVGLRKDFFPVFRKIYAEEDRVEVYCIDRKTGNNRVFKDAVLTQEPEQLTMTDGAEEMNLTLVFESFAVENGEDNDD